MPTSKSQGRGHEEKNRKGKLAKKASSFHCRISGSMPPPQPQLLRPKTVPDLLLGTSLSGGLPDARPKLTKLLLNVTISGSVGAVQVVITLESTVGDLIAAALKQHIKEGRRPILPTSEPSDFDLHYSQFSLESLDREEKLKELGSRNFFLCPKKSAVDGGVTSTSSSSCSKEAEKVTKSGFAWLKFMDFLL